jgi:hypothetical protein
VSRGEQGNRDGCGSSETAEGYSYKHRVADQCQDEFHRAKNQKRALPVIEHCLPAKVALRVEGKF